MIGRRFEFQISIMTQDYTVLQAVQQLTNWGILITDSQLRVTAWNAWLEARSGRRSQDVIGRNLIEVFPELASRGFEPFYRQVLEGQAVVLAQRLHGYLLAMPSSVEGDRNPHMQQSVKIAPLVEEGQVIGTLTVIEDVTERVLFEDESVANARQHAELEDALRVRVEQLALADRRKNEFLAMLAHELRNPLAPIQNALQLLRIKGPDESELDWARDVIERQVRQMGRLVDDLLDVSRITSGRISLQRETVELKAIFDQALEISRPIIDAHQHMLEVSLEGEPLFVNVDSTRLAQAVANIVNNAAKYTKDGGRIWLTGEREGKEVVIRVRDTGIGIAPEMLSSVFDLFCQADQSLDRSEGGLGIGLTLVHNLVAMHGGTVQAFSEGHGRGSEFVIRLPAATAVKARAVAPPVEFSSAAAQRILIVDDNADCANTLSMLLRMSGHAVETANGGLEALELAARTPPDVVFLDIGLPGMNGYEVARRLRQNDGRKDLLLVALSGYGQVGDRQRSNDAGFDHHLVKPVSLERLHELLCQKSAPGGP